jgi:O-antigen/teichoic acid export membrane protein
MNHQVKDIYGYFTGFLSNNSKLAAVDQGVISLANFASSILLTAWVSPTELGVYTLGFLAIYFVRAVQDGLIIQPLNTIGAGKSDADFLSFFKAVAIQQGLLSLLSGVSTAVLGWILIRTGNDTLGPAILVLWIAFPAWQYQEFLRRTFYTRGKVAKALWISITTNFVRLGMLFLFSLLGEVNGLTGLYAIGWGSLAGSIIGLLFARSYFSKNCVGILDVWRDNFRFGRWILGASVVDWVVLDLYPILIAGLISFAATGIYQTLQNLVAPIHVLLRAVDTFATPLMAKTFDQLGWKKFKQRLGLIYILLGIPVLGLLILVMFFTPRLLFLLKGNTYLPFADGIYIMGVFYFFLYLNRPLQLAFRALRQGKQIFIANILAMVSMALLGYWLISNWGVYGTIGGQALNAIIITMVLVIAWIQLNQKMGERE